MKANIHEDLGRHAEVERFSNRSTGLVFAAFFLVVAALPLLRGRPVRLWALGLSAGFACLALLLPKVLSPLSALWFRFGLLLGAMMNRVATAALFYLVFTPAAVVLRWLGKDLLRLRPSPEAPTYWIIRRPPGPAPETMKHQF